MSKQNDYRIRRLAESSKLTDDESAIILPVLDSITKKMHRINVMNCETSSNPRREKLDKMFEEQFKLIIQKIGFIGTINFEGDPRGATVILTYGDAFREIRF